MLTYSLSRSLSTNPLPTSCCNEICARPRLQVQATDEKCFLRDHPGGLSRRERKSESTHLLCYNRWNHATYENIPSIPIYDLSHWHVLACEAHPKSRAKCIGTNSVYCSIEAGDSMLVRGIEVNRKNSLCKFGANTYEKLTSTSPDVLQGLQIVDFHAWRMEARTLG
jgi:hypothetical protein